MQPSLTNPHVIDTDIICQYDDPENPFYISHIVNEDIYGHYLSDISKTQVKYDTSIPYFLRYNINCEPLKNKK